MFYGFNSFHFLGAIFAGLLFIVVAVVVVGLLVLLVRFLLVVTRAAEVYVRVHEPLKVDDLATPPPAPASTDPEPTTPIVTKPVTKRTPRTPPPA